MKRSALLFVLIAACATPWKPFEGHPVLASIKFEGNHNIHAGDLLKSIVTAPTSGFFSKTARYYDADLFEIDQKRIVRYYNVRGYYSAQVTGVDERTDDKGRVTLVVHIDEGRRAIVSAQDYQGCEALSKKELHNVDDGLPIHASDPFDEEVYEKAKTVLEAELKERGFAQAQVDGSVEIQPEQGTAHITFEVELGQRYTFGKVTVTGNRRISASEIAFATGINKGDRYSPQALALAQQRVYNLGTFSGVRVGLEPLGDSPVAGVRVTVREAPFQTFRFGVGGSAEEQRWELPRLHGEYANRSLFGGLRRLELSSTVGYAFVNSPFDFVPSQSGITSENTATLTIPNIWTPGLDSVNRAEFDREVQGGYAYDEVATRIGLLYRYQKHSFAPSINLVRYFLVDLRGSDLSKVVATAGTGAAIFNDCPSSCTLTYPELRYTYDARDSAIETTRGFYGTISLQQTLKPGSFEYFRLNPEVRYYVSYSHYVTFAARAEYGALINEGSSDASPFTQRFAFGGQNDQRGYAPLQQSPKLGAAPRCSEDPFPCLFPYATQTVSIGGKTAMLFSFEARFKVDFILNHLGIVPFVDISRVSDDLWSKPFAHVPEVAPGIGLRYITPFGPVRADVGFLANPQDQYTQPVTGKDPATGRTINVVLPTRVSVHCAGTDPACISYPRYAFHITLGEAF